MAMKNELFSAHLRISGTVQGVFYRSTAQKIAQEIGLVGWVRNCSDGTVEAVAQGTKKQLDDFVEFCKRGPPMAMVRKVVVNDGGEYAKKSEKEFQTFAVRRSA